MPTPNESIGDDDLAKTPTPGVDNTERHAAFTVAENDFLRACRDAGLGDDELERVRKLWGTWSTLAVDSDEDTDDVFRDTLARFKKDFPKAKNAAKVAERVWEQVVGLRAFNELIAKRRGVVGETLKGDGQ